MVSMKNEIEVKPGEDRRKKTPWDMVTGAGGISSAGIGLFVLNLLMSQTATLDRHGDMIQSNREASKEVLEELDGIKSEFSLDIQGFKIKHLTLSDQFEGYERQQMTIMHKLEDIEDIEASLGQWKDLEIRLKAWVTDRFARKADND